MLKILKLSIPIFFLSILVTCQSKKAESDLFSDLKNSSATLKLDKETASHFASLALRCIQCEYPNKPGHVINDSSEVKNPRSLHPAFYGCFDWHSAVHGHWMLVRLLKAFPDIPEANEIRQKINQNLTQENIAAETAYFRQRNRKSFERTYGWAWLLKLAAELHNWDDEDGKIWRQNLQPLEDEIVDRYFNFLPQQEYPIRRGVHANTAFGLALALDYAKTVQNARLESLLVRYAKKYFLHDEKCPANYEPDGDDFLSPCLMEADLMRRILPKGEFFPWLKKFLPDIFEDDEFSLLQPANVSDRSDPKIVHLDGLNLSRAWCLTGIYRALPENFHLRNRILKAAMAHANHTLPFIASGNYEGEHWLASFAVYFLSEWEKVISQENLKSKKE